MSDEAAEPIPGQMDIYECIADAEKDQVCREVDRLWDSTELCEKCPHRTWCMVNDRLCERDVAAGPGHGAQGEPGDRVCGTRHETPGQPPHGVQRGGQSDESAGSNPAKATGHRGVAAREARRRRIQEAVRKRLKGEL